MNVVMRVSFVTFIVVVGLADAVLAQAPRSRSQRRSAHLEHQRSRHDGRYRRADSRRRGSSVDRRAFQPTGDD